jgi:hypothetical protein
MHFVFREIANEYLNTTRTDCDCNNSDELTASQNYSGIKIYNHLPTAIKDLSDDKNKFKLALKDTSYIIPFTVWRNILIHN